MERKIIQTEDGSSTLFVPELNEQYHSIHGAIQESNHVFIKAGLRQSQKKHLKIFEMGFGTGLNFLLTYLNTEEITVEYYCIEAYPLEKNIIDQLNYTSQLSLSEQGSNDFKRFHSTETEIQLRDNFSIFKTYGKLKDFNSSEKFDLIYYDAFAPEVQPELWTADVFHKLFEMTTPEGILTTYCAKGQVRRNMIEAGYKVERLSGPPGKREMLRARKAKNE